MAASELNVARLHFLLEVFEVAGNPENDSLKWSADGSLLIVNLPALALYLQSIISDPNPLVWFLQHLCGAGFAQCPLEAVGEAEYNAPPDHTVLFWHPHFHRNHAWFNYQWNSEHSPSPWHVPDNEE
ncbi:uncharacterized protein LOC121596371 [Anopheles merus]|uniref:HSF-type DNA-binding domain-containing protein n=1 Tax=Anopheles merus TaxID=30066 RepID=A0A182V5E4_ANOME|nr:uncharacterized protein LOC121596371 [Anopheles merus]